MGKRVTLRLNQSLECPLGFLVSIFHGIILDFPVDVAPAVPPVPQFEARLMLIIDGLWTLGAAVREMPTGRRLTDQTNKYYNPG